MVPYTYNNNYYDPVGSQANQQQPQGYTYTNSQQQSSTNTSQYPSQTPSGYQTNYSQSYNNNAYANQQYSTAGQQQQPSSNTTRATNQSYTQQSSDSRNNTASGYDNSYYTTAFAAINDRSQSNNSPLYQANSGSSTFGRLSVPDQSQSSSNTFGANSQTYQSTNASSRTYQNAPSSASRGLGSYQSNAYTTQQQQQQPQRYASPLHAVQAQQQQGHTKQSSRTSNHAASPQMAVRNAQQQQNNRQQTASVEPSPTTVDPSQVYDMRAEQQRKAQIEAEKRKRLEAAKRAEEEARAAEEAKRKAIEDQKAEKERLEREKREAEEAAEAAKKAEEEAAKKKAQQDKKNEQRRKAREEKRQSKTAATALTQMASSSGPVASGPEATMAAMMGMGMGDMSAPPVNDEEAEMRAMFKKMREFNSRNPAMLAKLWEEERRAHADQSPTQPDQAQPQPPPPQQPKQGQKAPPKQNFRVSTASIASPAANPPQQQQYRPKPTPTPATQAPPQPVMAPPQNNALWPPHKKGSLAEAAARWLGNLPENASFGRTISKETILKILDANPSYVQLCESIEKTGIRFERSALAKELLKAVPDGLRNQPAAAKPSTPVTPAAAIPASDASAVDSGKKKGRAKKDGPLSYAVPPQSRRTTGTVSYSTPTFTSLADAAREVNSMGTDPTFPHGVSSTVASAITNANGTPSTQLSIGQGFLGGDSRPVSQQAELKDEPIIIEPEEPPRPPADKEEAARKRTFNDLVDLTNANDSDDDGPPRKMLQPISGPTIGAVKHQAPPPNNTFMQPMSYNSFMQQPMRAVGQGAMPPAHVRPNWATYIQQDKPSTPIVASQPIAPRPKRPTEEQKQQERMRGKMLVEPIMRDRVARKSRYDSRTIARDVLLATGRHPDMRALNSHLNSMQKLLGDHGGVVDGAGNKSDLATIRWDIIDPGEPLDSAKSKAKAPAQDEFADADDEGEDHEVEDGPSRAPSMPAPKALPEVDQDREAAKMREIMDIATPEEREKIAAGDDKMSRQVLNRLQQRHWRARHKAGLTKTREKRPRAGGEGDSNMSITDKLREEGLGDTTEDDPEVVLQQLRNDPANLGKAPRRGRPPKSSGSKGASPTTNNNANTTPVGTPAPTSSGKMASGVPVGYSQFKQFDENGNPIKKKGRPVGWRKSIHSREAQGLTPAKSASASKNKGTPSRLRQSAGAEVNPHYEVYHCRWQGCKAELDNVDRLKKHVLRLHGIANDDGVYECLWSRCNSAGKHVDVNGKVHKAQDDDVASFESIEGWMKHIDKEHVNEVAWQLGDGPRGGAVSDIFTDSESYLSDAQGRSVTPLIVPLSERTQNMDLDADEPILKSDLPGPKKMGRPSKKHRPEAELAKLRAQKIHEGPTMGREGSRLATAKRRAGFLDDEDFEEVVDGDGWIDDASEVDIY